MKSVFISVAFLMMCLSVFSQETIVFRNGDEVEIKLLEINPHEIKYKKYDNPEGATIIVLKADVLMIKYKNGTKDVFAAPTNVNAVDLTFQGKSEAGQYFRTAAFAGTLWPTVLFAPAGLICAIVISSSEPKPERYISPHKENLKNADYLRGYTLGAKRKKKVKAWSGFGVGMAINLAVAVILTTPRK